jgi:threonine/homoserine/homoserine lactone efflux protein
MDLALVKYVSIGAGLAFTAAVQPGPLQAYLFNRATSIGWRRTLPAACSPLLSDGPIALVALLILGRLSPALQSVLRIAGGVLLLYLSWSAFRRSRQEASPAPEPQTKVPRTFFEAALVNLLNPNPYLGWALILGPIVVAAWRESAGLGVAVVGSFYATMITTLALLIALFGSARFLSARLQRLLAAASIVILVGIAGYQLWTGLSFLLGGRP